MPQFYANPSPFYQPAMRLISSITQADPAAVTTTFAHDFVSGTTIRLDIPSYIGMHQANSQVVEILTILGPTSFTVGMNSTTYAPFVIPDPLPTHASTTAVAVPVGEITRTLEAATLNVLPYN